MAFKIGNKLWKERKKNVSWNKGKKCPQISAALRGTKRPDLSERNRKSIKERKELICFCGKKFKVVPSRVQYKPKYCSKICYHRYTSHARAKGKRWNLSKETKIRQGLSQIGSKNHQWKGGRIRNKVIGVDGLRIFSREVFKRDNFLCRICGDTGRKAKLNAHHLNSVDNFPLEAGDVNNGVTLCYNCHRRFHKRYGYGKNTKEQFEEFDKEKIEKIEKIEMNKSTIYNISLEEGDSFYANGILNHNTNPRTIVPVNKKALKFKVGNKEVFAKKVRRGAVAPNPFIRETIQIKVKRIVIEEINRVMNP